MTRRPRAAFLRIALLVLLILLLLTVSWPVWLPLIGRALLVSDPLQPADAMVVLGGNGQERMERAAELFRSGCAHWVIVTDMPLRLPGVRTDHAELMKIEAVWQGIPGERIVRAPGTVTSTYGEALAVRQTVEEHGWHSLIIVTDPYHTRRARMIFHDAFRGAGVTLIVWPIASDWYRPDYWWQYQDGLLLTWTEYVKLVLYVVGYR